MTEAELLAGVLEVASVLGYLCHHDRPAWTSRGYRTAISGNVGFPDIVLAGHGRLIVRELKVDRGKVSAEQAAWLEELAAAGVDASVWTDEDWRSGVVEAELRT